MATLPPPLARLATTPVLRAEMPAGFTRATISELPADARYHTLGSVRIDFKSAHISESAGYALFATSAQAATFARAEAKLATGGLFHVAVARVGQLVVGTVGATRGQAQALLRLALAHLARSER